MPRAVADLVAQQVTIEPVVDEVALVLRGRTAGQTNALQEWRDNGGTVRSYIEPDGDHYFTNGKGILLAMSSGNAGYIIAGSGSSQLQLRGGSGGTQFRNNADSATNLTIADNGVITAGGNIGSYRHATLTNVVQTIDNGSGSTYTAFSPVPHVAWHNLLAFHKWWGTPTFERYTAGAWGAGTLDNSLFDGKESNQTTVIDGTTYTAARWTWNSAGNMPFSYAYAWFLFIPYSGTPVSKDFLIESSANGTAWTTRHTSTGNTTTGAIAYLHVNDWGGDSYIRLTITVTNAQPLLLSSIKALSSRPSNQGGGVDLEYPYEWDSSRRIAIGAGATPGNAPLTVGTNTSGASGGIYFGTDTSLYRDAAGVLRTATLRAAQFQGGDTGEPYAQATTSGWNFYPNADRVVVRVRAHTSQTSNMFEWTNNGATTTYGYITNGGTLNIDTGGGALSLRPSTSDHVYMQFFADSASPSTRSAYFGFGSGGTTRWSIYNEMTGGDIFIRAQNGVEISGQNADQTALEIRGHASQTAHIQTWYNAAAVQAAAITPNGSFLLRTTAQFGTASSAAFSVQSPSAASEGIVVRGFSGQTEDIQRWENDSGGDWVTIKAGGSFRTVSGVHAGDAALDAMAGHSPVISADSGSLGAGFVPFIARGHASQSGNLQEWQDSTGAVLVAITAAGVLNIPASAGAGKVLTSDGSGNATWQAASGGGGSGSIGRTLMLMGG